MAVELSGRRPSLASAGRGSLWARRSRPISQAAIPPHYETVSLCQPLLCSLEPGPVWGAVTLIVMRV